MFLVLSGRFAKVLSQPLGLVISCGFHWRNLVIRIKVKNSEDSAIGKVRDLMCVTIYTKQQPDYPSLLDPQHIHMLEHLGLGEDIRLDDFSAAANLKFLRLQCSQLGERLLLLFMSLRTLTALPNSLWNAVLFSDSVHSSFLEPLSVVLGDLQATMTPRLGYFTWCPLECWSMTFADLEGKFPNVRHFCLRYSQNFVDYASTKDTVAIYAAFLGARQIEMLLIASLFVRRNRTIALCPLPTTRRISNMCPSEILAARILVVTLWNGFVLENFGAVLRCRWRCRSSILKAPC